MKREIAVAVAVLPYLASPGSLGTVFERIKKAATPERVTGEVVANTFLMKGGAGSAILPYLKRINFVGSDGSPTDIYRRFRNDSTAGGAVAEAIMHGYAPLKAINEQFYKTTDAELKSMIIQVTGAAADSSSVSQTLGTLKKLISYADFDAVKPANLAYDNSANLNTIPPAHVPPPPPSSGQNGTGVGLNLAYTINLNLPATSDQAVFNAIFRSLREHLLSVNDE